MPTERRIPESRLERLMHLGRLAGGIAGSALGEGARPVSYTHLRAHETDS